MYRIFAVLALALALGGLAYSQNQTNPAIVGGTGAYNTAPPTCTNGNWCTIQTDVNGNLKIVNSGTPSGTQDVNVLTSSTAGSATTSASSTAAASNLVLKASAGNLYSLTTTIGATTGYLMLFDATALPSNGAVTPVLCYPIISNGTQGGVSFSFFPPKRFGTGITAGFSTTGCFTLTASATGNFFGGYQ